MTMTTPWKQNCPHTDNGWCVQCVSRLGDAIEDYRNNDGSRGTYSAIELSKARVKLDAALINCETCDESHTAICQQCGKAIDKYDDPQICPHCATCPGCEGRGFVEFGHYAVNGPWTETCKNCGGTGISP